MAHPNKGVRIGNYRITPLGLITLAVLLVIILAVIALVVLSPFEDGGIFAPKITPTPTIDPASITPTPTPKPTPSPTPEPEPRSATIRSLGEIAIQPNLLLSAVDGNEFDFSEMFSEIKDVVGNADYTVADVEGTLGGTLQAAGDNTKLITPPKLIDNLKDCGVDMLMMANDHALDGAEKGFEELQAGIQNVKAAGLDYVGVATSDVEKQMPVIKDINGIRVGFLAYTETLNGNEKKTGTDATKFGVNLISKSNAKKDIQACRMSGANVVVVYMSWGEMFNRELTDNQKKAAEFLVECGADVIIGYGPHVVQPAFWLEPKKPAADGTVHRTLVMCATGNFLSDQRDQYSDSGVIFQFTIQETGPATNQFTITAPTYIPTYVWRYKGEDDKYNYRTLAVGQWLDQKPEGMSYSTDATRMSEVWAEVQNIMGKEVAQVAAE